ncbi:hypothetical protein [Muricoccus radiodurans]|uniref:hypothetical protein n=1 Tax=Muricoccus radiodurans TaxID=2231721 RepID=UPI003CE753CE
MAPPPDAAGALDAPLRDDGAAPRSFVFSATSIRYEHSVNLLHGEDILLHVKIRNPSGTGGGSCVLVVNDQIGGAWGREMTLPVEPRAEDGAVVVRLRGGPEGMAVEVPGAGNFLFPRGGNAFEVAHIRQPPGITLLREPAPEATEPAPEVPAPPPPAAAPPPPAVPAPSTTQIVGSLDNVSAATISGWALDRSRPGVPVSVDIFVDDVLAVRVLADRFRADLQAAGLNDGLCAFVVPAPASLADGRPHTVRLTPTNAGAELRNSPRTYLFEEVDLPPRSAKEPERAGRSGHANSLQPLLAFARLTGLEAGTVMRAALAGMERPGTELPDLPLDLRRCGVLHDEFAGGSITVADIWLAADDLLRLRVNAPPAEGEPDRLRFFQPHPTSAGEIEALGEPSLSPEGLSFLDVTLANPFMPVLVVAQTGGGALLGTTILPFPSLCRGGAHYGEALLLSDAPVPIDGLRRLSDALIREIIGPDGAPAPYAIGAVEVDLRGATGAERIFGPFLLDWMARFAGLRVTPGEALPDMDPRHRAVLEAALATPFREGDDGAARERAARGEAVLRLPPDAIPTLAALFRRRHLTTGGMEGRIAYITADARTGRPTWSVSLPVPSSDLLALQPRDAPDEFPRLRGPDGAVLGGDEVSPFAIRFIARSRDHDAALLRPVAPDSLGPILRSAATGADVSVLITSRVGVAGATAFLESLALQGVEVPQVLVASHPADSGRLQALAPRLDRLVPGRHGVVTVETASLSAEINALAEAVTGRFLLLVNEPVVLHDTRTLDTLLALLQPPDVASAACVLVREGVFRKGSAVTFHAGGYYPSHVSLLSAPRLILTEPNSVEALPFSTVPVAANSFRMVLLRASAWRELGGLDAARFPHHHADIDFGLRAWRFGYRQLCTATVRASSLARQADRDHLDPLAPAALPPSDWSGFLAACTILRELRG